MELVPVGNIIDVCMQMYAYIQERLVYFNLNTIFYYVATDCAILLVRSYIAIDSILK